MGKKDLRRGSILDALRTKPTVRASELADRFGVSIETVRRDMIDMSHQGLIDRTYGGAAITSIASEPGVDVRAAVNRDGRQRMAERAARMVINEEDDMVMIDAGSTTTIFAQVLAGAFNASHGGILTVVTNSYGVARALGTNNLIRTIVCPGEFDLTEAAVFGSETQGFLSRFRSTSAVISAGGLTVEGATDADSRACWIKRTMRQRSNRVILLADHVKFERPFMETALPLDDIDWLITDVRPASGLSLALRKAYVEVEVARERG